MPLPLADREIELLTEGWPAEPENSELAAFAATFRADRPELAPPALDRVFGQIDRALAGRERLADRLDRARRTLWKLRRLTPLAAAAAVLAVAIGAWTHFRPGSAGEHPSPSNGVPVLHTQPAPSPEAPRPDRPVVN